MGKIPIGLQLYSIRHDCQNDLPGCLAKVAAMGYDGVEFAGYYGWSAPDIKKMLDDRGLTCCGGHLGLNLLTGDALAETMEFQRILANPYLICPGLPGDRTSSRAAWTETAKLFNDIAAKVRPDGFVTGYHNHHTEFTPLDGELPWDTFFGHTADDVVMQLDMGNGLYGGADLVDLLAKYPGRATTVHLKPFKKGLPGHDGFKPLIGDDDVPWADVFSICESTGGTKWYIVEYESDKYPPLEAVERCLKNLRAMGK